jgi:hypothetical protein
MLKFLMVAEDVTITEEVLVVGGGRSSAPEEKEALLQEEGSGGGFRRKFSPREGGFDQEAHQLKKRRWFSSDRPRRRFI